MNLFGCNDAILPLVILLACCGNECGIGGVFGGKGSGGCDELLWLLVLLCVCGQGGRDTCCPR